ncbi:MAG TPA: hypothetical protein DCQ36_07900 [Actinobacteria bacterium]|jgi:hypothetical protein|nr:hypothetical protein [Actinomycetota bacterium]
MTPGRLPLLAAGTVVLAVALTGCTKPAPGATVFSGTASAYREAACWSFDETPIDATTCAQEVLDKASSGASLATVPVLPGTVVGISVDPAVADAGWTPRIAGQPLVASPLTTTYWRFTFPEFQELGEDGLAMEIVAGDSDGTRGIWLFELTPA